MIAPVTAGRAALATANDARAAGRGQLARHDAQPRRTAVVGWAGVGKRTTHTTGRGSTGLGASSRTGRSSEAWGVSQASGVRAVRAHAGAEAGGKHRGARRGTPAVAAAGGSPGDRAGEETDRRPSGVHAQWWKPLTAGGAQVGVQGTHAAGRRQPAAYNAAAAAASSSSPAGRYGIDFTNPGAKGVRRALGDVGGGARPMGRLPDTRSVFERSGGFIYIRNFFSQRDYEMLLEECESLRAEVGAERRACARQRLGTMVPPDHIVQRAFMNQRVAERLSGLVNRSLMPADVPVEFRIYPVGSCMDWHQDVALYTEPQYELVFTLSNTSDSQTEWQDEQGNRRGGWTEPNSIIMVQAESVVHRVTPICSGEREIVKFVYTTTLDKTEEYYDNLLTYS